MAGRREWRWGIEKMTVRIGGIAKHGGGQRIYMKNRPQERDWDEKCDWASYSLVAASRRGDYPVVANKSVRIYVRPVIALFPLADRSPYWANDGVAIADAGFQANTTILPAGNTDAEFVAYEEHFMTGDAKKVISLNPDRLDANLPGIVSARWSVMASGKAFGVIVRTERWNKGNTAKEAVLDSHDPVALEWGLTVV